MSEGRRRSRATPVAVEPAAPWTCFRQGLTDACDVVTPVKLMYGCVQPPCAQCAFWRLRCGPDTAAYKGAAGACGGGGQQSRAERERKAAVEERGSFSLQRLRFPSPSAAGAAGHSAGQRCFVFVLRCGPCWKAGSHGRPRTARSPRDTAFFVVLPALSTAPLCPLKRPRSEGRSECTVDLERPLQRPPSPPDWTFEAKGSAPTLSIKSPLSPAPCPFPFDLPCSKVRGQAHNRKSARYRTGR